MYVYFGTYFFLYETTQIRVGVASAFLLLSVQNIAQKNLKSFLLKACAAFLFHYQSLVMLPLYFLKANRVNKVFYSVLPIVGILLGKTRLFDGILKNSLIFFPEILSFKLNSYLILQEHGVFAELNVLRSTYMYGLLIFYYSILLLSDRISKKEDVISLKIFGWGIFSYYSLPFLPVLSVRISEFLLVTIIFVLPSMIGLLKERFLPFLAVVIFTTLRLASLLLQYRLFVL